MSLSLLPTEIQCSIVRLLDPVSLISISQTCTHFRRLVSPSKRHLIERLLALETILQHGGESPLFNPCENTLQPGPNDPEWASIRWACTDCLRLLSDAHFDDHSILKLAYRKPTAVSSVHELPPTTWEPVGAIRLRRKTESEEALLSDKKLRQRYLICVTAGRGTAPQHEVPMFNRLDVLQDCGMEGFQDLTEEEFRDMTLQEKTEILQRNARAIENERAGYRRRLRACNECRYRRRKIHPKFPGYDGTARMPIVPSRQILFRTHLDRWFPGLSDILETQRPEVNPVLFRIYRVDPRDQPISTYMARCPQCERWRELRAFRIGGMYQHWKPAMATEEEDASVTWDGKEITQPLLDEASCNACFASTNGREELGRVLLDWVNRLIYLELILITPRLRNGSFAWWGARGTVPDRYRKELKWMRRHTPCLHKDREDMLTYSDVAQLKLRQAQFKDMLGRLRRDTGTNTADKVGAHGKTLPGPGSNGNDDRIRHVEEAEEWWAADSEEGTHWSLLLDPLHVNQDADHNVPEPDRRHYQEEEMQSGSWPADSDEAEASWTWMMGSLPIDFNAGGFDTSKLEQWYETWSNDFDEAEAHWRWLMGVRVELAERPEALVEWALSRT